MNWSDAITAMLLDLGLPMRLHPGLLHISHPPSIPAGYNPSGDLFPPETDYTPTSLITSAAGDLTSTGNDMYQWLAFHMGQTGLIAIQNLMQSKSAQPRKCMAAGPQSGRRARVVRFRRRGWRPGLSIQGWRGAGIHVLHGVSELVNTKAPLRRQRVRSDEQSWARIARYSIHQPAPG